MAENTESEVLNERFTLARKLGMGSLGEVWLASDRLRDDRDIILKFVSPSRNAPLLTEALRNDFRELRRLTHPNIASLYDFAEVGETGEHFFTREYLDWLDFFSATDGVSVEELLKVLVQAARALEYLHFNHVLHLDIRPENMFLQQTEEGLARIKLVDFGFEEWRRRIGHSHGRKYRHFVAPEVRKNRMADRRADFYSLGMMFLHACTRKKPDALTPHDLDRHDVPEPLYAVLKKMLARAPADRYDYAHEIVEELSELTGCDFTVGGGETGRIFLPYCPFTGRSDELEILKYYIDSKYAPSPEPGIPDVVVISGETGVGKSRLVAEAARHASLGGITVVEGASYESSPAPYSAVRDIIDDVIELVGVEDVLVTEAAGELSRIVPELVECFGGELPDGGPRQVPREEDSVKTAWAAADFIFKAAEKARFALHLSDLHFADEGTAAFVDYFLRKVERGRAAATGRPTPLVFISMRSAEAQSGPLAGVIDRLDKEGLVKRMNLDRFGRIATDVLVTSVVGSAAGRDKLIDKVYNSSQGNALFIIETMKMLFDDGVISYDRGAWRIDSDKLKRYHIPETAEAVFLKRISRLGEKHTEVLEIISCFEEQVPLQVVRKMCGRDVFDVLDDLERQEILRLKGDSDGVSCSFSRKYLARGSRERLKLRNVMMREVIYSRMSDERKKELHERIAGTIERDFPDIAEKAPQIPAYHLQESGHTDGAADYALAAARRFEDVSSYAKASEFYRSVIDNLPGDDSRSLESRLELALIERIAGSPDRSLEMLGALVDEDLSEELQVKVHNAIGNVYWVQGKYDEALYFFEEGLELARGLGDDAVLASALNDLGNLYFTRGAYPEALSYQKEALKFAKKNGDAEMLTHIYHDVGEVYFHMDNFEKPAVFYGKSLELAEQSGDKRLKCFVLLGMGDYYHSRGFYSRAAECTEKSLEISEEIGERRARAACNVVLGRVFREKDERSRSLLCLKRGLALYESIGVAYGAAEAEMEIARHHLDESLDNWLKPGEDVHAAEARKYLQKAKARVAELGNREMQVETALLEAVLLHSENRDDEAAELFRKTINSCTEVRGSLAARVGFEYGKFLLDVDEVEDGLKYLEKARMVYRNMVALGYRTVEFDEIAELVSRHS